MKRKPDFEESSGNVFADLGFRNSKQEMLKARLTVEIYKLLKKRGSRKVKRRSCLAPLRRKSPR